MNDEDKRHQAAAFWGLAENKAYSADERLSCALKALELMSELVPGWDE